MLQRGRVSALKSTQTYPDKKTISQKSTTPRNIVPYVNTENTSPKKNQNQNLLSFIKHPASSSRTLCARPELAWAWSSRAASAPPRIQPRGLLLHVSLPSSLSSSEPSSAPDTSPSFSGAPRILDIFRIRRHRLGCAHNSDMLLAPKSVA